MSYFISLNKKSVTQSILQHIIPQFDTCITKNMRDTLHKSDLSEFLIQIK